MTASATAPSQGSLAQAVEPSAQQLLGRYVARAALGWLATSPGESHKTTQGTLLYVDVSGFTALTERLAASGKAGAEEITDIIAAVFTEMLGVGARYGADLWKWGGDAALLFYAEPHSAARACRAAFEMSRTMASIGRLRTSAGLVTLGVSIGAHTGSFDLYLLGERHRELVLTGPAATEVARMEAIAESGEIVVSPSTAGLLDESCIGAAKGEGVLLVRAPEADAVPIESVPISAGVDVGTLFSEESRAHLLSDGEDSEHRQAVIAFVEFSGIDALVAESGHGAVVDWLEPVVRSAQEAAARHGVSFHSTDIGADGGKIILLGGVPVVRGNDAERLLRAVHDVVNAQPDSSPVRLRAGVNSGRVFVFSHAVGLGDRCIFSITGDAVNLAARVMSQAEPGQILVTTGVLEASRTPFERTPVPPFAVKGKSEPVVAFALGAPSYGISEESGSRFAFVGRDTEMELLLGDAAAAEDGRGGVVELVGPPGIGKSRLVTEVIERWELDTVRVACELYGGNTAYLPFRRVLRRMLGTTDDAEPASVVGELQRVVSALLPDLEPYLPLLADVVGVTVEATREVDELEPRFRRARLEDCVVRLLAALLTRPGALVFEDAHAIDEASADLLARLAGEAVTLPLLILLTRQPRGAIALPQATRHRLIDLQPLAGVAAFDLAGSNDAVALSPSQMASIVDRAGGNPLFLRELVRLAGETGSVEDLPDSLEPLLVAEIDRLDAADRRVLRAASVLGEDFDPEVLTDLVDEGSVLDGALWTRLGSFVAPTARGRRFAHGLMRAAAYEGLPFRRRRELHARAARAIEARTTNDDAAELLSLHWLEAEGFEQAWHYSRVAGDRARAMWANEAAGTFYDRAMKSARRLHDLSADEVATVAETLGDCRELTATYDQARRAFTLARSLRAAGKDQARLLRKLGVLYERQGRYREALSCYSRGRRQLDASDPASEAELVELDLASAGIRSRQGRYHECVRFATEAATLAERGENRAGLAHALYLQHLMSVYLGEPKGELAERALAIFVELGDLVGQGNVLNNLGIDAYYRGDWSVALDLYERSREARLRSGDVVGAATEENNIAEILSDQGDLDAARRAFVTARTTWRAAGYRAGVALATSNLGRLEARAGDVGAGRAHIAEALSDFRDIHSAMLSFETELRLIECDVLDGDFATALVRLSAFRGAIDGTSGLEQVGLAALRLEATASALFDLEGGARALSNRSVAHLDEAIAAARSLGAPYELALALASRAAISRRLVAEDASRTEPSRRQIRLDSDEAESVFDSLGVSSVAITWSTDIPGGVIAVHVRGADERVDEAQSRAGVS